MAFQTGSQVRPELGRADLSGFARAGESIGAALASVGKSVGEGFEKYQENKEVTTASLAALEAISVSRPDAYAELRNSDKKIGNILRNIEDGNYKRNDLQSAIGALQTSIAAKDARRASELQDLQLRDAQSEQKSRDAAGIALSASREAGTGNINTEDAVAAYISEGGRDPNFLKIIESMQEVKGPNLEAIEVGPFTVLTQDGKTMQAFRDGKEVSPSALQTLEGELGQLNRARKLYNEGDETAANDILAILGLYKDILGNPKPASEVFGPLKPNDPSDDPSGLDKAVLNNTKPFDPDALTGDDKEAYDFAIKNPNHPRSDSLLRSLGAPRSLGAN